MKTLRFMIVAGEASGDGHAAKLVDAIREIIPDGNVEFFGSAGPRMRGAGVAATVKADDLSIVGVAEIGRALPMFMRTMKTLKAVAAEKQPDVAILVDFPDFNLKLAKHLKKQGIKVVYYISPQLWAWRRYRLSTVKKYVDLMLTILPFEKDWYAEHGVTHIEYVGSPLANEVHADRTKEQFCFARGLDPLKTIITLLPGSRHKEIVRILPVMLEAAEKLASDHVDAQFVIAIGSAKQRKDIDQFLLGSHLNITVVENETYDALNASDAAAVTSGTATLETGIIGTPQVIVYKTSAINYNLLKPLIDVPHYGLINLIAGERLVKELIQSDFTAQTLADEINRLLQPDVNSEMRVRLKETAGKLGHGGASKRAAKAILNVVG
ncbi:MAG: lipid-A-disaccharide synthase [Chloracidobacterium sp.]|nr:lipid-A-disaccharide synthase [Chloracidobacterium sp.]